MSPERQLLTDKAGNLFEKNHRVGIRNGIEYDYTCPSPSGYPHQWKWDSAFHAIALTHLDTDRAQNEISTLLSRQREDGFIPCVNIWERRFPLEGFLYVSKITQPPVLPIAVEKILDQTGNKEFVKRVYPRLKKAGEWLTRNRDRNGNGLLEIVHPWEDGDDRNPSFDKQLGVRKNRLRAPENFYLLLKILAKYSLMNFNEDAIYTSNTFVAETALFNSIYAMANLSMSRLSKVAGYPEDSQSYIQRYQIAKDAMLQLMWSDKDEIFYDLDREQKQSGIKSISSLMPLILPDLPEQIYKPLIENHLLNPREYWTEFPVASVSQKEPVFHPGDSFELWRGPTWINTNWFLANALVNYGYEKPAAQLVKKTAEMIKAYGFREFYNPFSGEGYGQKNFGWSTLVIDMLGLI